MDSITTQIPLNTDTDAKQVKLQNLIERLKSIFGSLI